MCTGMALEQPSLLTPGLMLVHCDLKIHSFSHRAAFPYIVLDPRPVLVSASRLADVPGGEAIAQTLNDQRQAGKNMQPCLMQLGNDGTVSVRASAHTS